MPQAAASTSLIMPAWTAGRYYQGQDRQHRPRQHQTRPAGLHGTYLLFDGRTGVPLA
ncbi:MAG: hypothetical protein R3E42_11840 [Burkholderiaceae bacterium]